MPVPAGRYPALVDSGRAVIPATHQNLISQGIREREKGTGTGTGAGAYSQWKYWATILITNPVNQTDYQHKLTLSWLPGMRHDFRDIRFTNRYGKALSYWIETYTSKTSATVWIKVPTANTSRIYLYYGNGSVSSASSGGNVFDVFDNFDDASINARWTVTTGNGAITESDGTLNLDYTGSENNDWWTSGRNQKIVKLASMPTGQFEAVVTLGAFTAPDRTFSGISVYQDDTHAYTFGIARNDPHWNHTQLAKLGTDNIANNANTTTPIQLKIRRTTTNYSFHFTTTIGGAFTQVGTTYSDLTFNNIVLFGKEFGTNNLNLKFDNFYVKKYSETEPTLSLSQHGPNPAAQIIYYPFISARPGAVGGNNYVMDPIEFSMIYGIDAPTVDLVATPVPFTLTHSVATPSSGFGVTVPFTLNHSVKVSSKIFIDLTAVKLKKVTISKNIQASMWQCQADIDGYLDLDMTVYKHITYATTDHLGVTHNLFTGVTPGSQPTLGEADNPAAKVTSLTAYDYGWYLSQRYVPTAYLHNTATTNPADIIRGLLGGDDWLTETGIEPYNIFNVDEWGVTLNTRVFDFDKTTTRQQAIEKICEYCRYVFIVGWRVAGSQLIPCAYFCHEDDVDTELDLPSPVTIANPDSKLLPPIRIVNQGDLKYNTVTVEGRSPAGTVYTCTLQTEDVANGDEIPVEYIERSGAWTTQTQVNARCAELFAYYSNPARTYEALFNDRVDLTLLQKIQFTGRTADGIPEDWMRIIDVRYEISDNAEKTCKIQFTSDQKLSAMRRMYRAMNPDPVGEVESIFDAKAAAMPGNDVGVVTAINEDRTEATVLLKDGRTVTARIV